MRKLTAYIVVLLSFFYGETNAQTKLFTGIGSWHDAARWSPSGVPTSTDIVLIAAGASITLSSNATCDSVYFQSGSTASTLTISNAVKLTINKGIAFSNPTANVTQLLNVGSGEVECLGITMPDLTSGRVNKVTVSSGNVTLNGNLSMLGSTSENIIEFSSFGKFRLGGTWTTTGGTFTMGSSTFEYFSNVTQVINSRTYNKLILSGGTKNPSGSVTCNDSLIINAGATLNNSGTASLTMNSVFYIAGTYIEGSTSGSVTLVGLVHVANTGTFQVNVAEIFAIRGGIKNEGTFISGNGTYTFATNNQELSGNKMITFSGGVTVTGITLTAYDSVRINGTFQGTGTFVNQSYLLLMGVTNTITNLNLSSVGNIVEYGAAGNQTVKGSSYKTLRIRGSGTKTANANITVDNLLHIDSGPTLAMSTFLLSLNPSCLTAGNGNLSTANTTSSPIPAGMIWPFNTITYNSASAQTIVNGTYNNLTSSSVARTLSNNGAIIINGVFTPGTGVYTSTNSTVQFNSGGTQTVAAIVGGYNKLILNGGIKNPSGSLICNDSLIINTGATLNNSGTASLTMNGVFFIAGTYIEGSTSGSVTLVGLVHIANTGTFQVNVAEIFAIRGGIKNEGTFISGNGTYTFATNNQELSGNKMITFSGGVTITGITLTASDSVRINGTFQGTGTYLNKSYLLLMGATNSITNLDLSSTGNTVEYGAAGNQAVKGSTYKNLRITGSGTKTVNANITVDNLLFIDAVPTLAMSTFLLSLSPGCLTTGTGSLSTANTTSTPIPAGKIWPFTTIIYNSASAQTIVNGTYNNLTSSNAARTLSAVDTIHIKGIFTPSTGTYTSAGSTVNFNSNAAQNIPPINGGYNRLVVTGGTTKTATSNIIINGDIRVDASTTLNMQSFTLTGASMTNTGTGNIQTNAPSGAFTNGRTWICKIRYTNPSDQSIITGTYSNIELTGSGATKTANGIITVNGNLTIESGVLMSMLTNMLTGALTSTSGNGTLSTSNTSTTPIPTNKDWSFTIRYSSASAQNVVAGNYTNLNCTGGTRVISSSGNVRISGAYTPASANTIAGSTIEFNGEESQTIPVSTYNNLLSTNNGARTLASGTITVQGNYSPGTNSYTTTGNTMVFNNATQSLSGTFNNLTLSTAGTKTANGNIDVAGTLNIATGVTLDLTNSYLLTGTISSISNSGNIKTAVPTTHSPTPIPSGKTWNGTLEFSGTSQQTLTNGTYNNLIINGGSEKSTSGNVIINGTLTFTSGKLDFNNTTLTIGGPIINTVSEGLKSGGNASLILNGNQSRTLSFDQTTPGVTNKLNSFTNNTSSSTTTIGNMMLITDVITPTSGTINANGNITLLSNSTKTARIAQGTGNYITGNVKVQRYIPESARRWRFVSSPVSNATLEDWRGEIFITGPGTGSTIGTTNSNGYDATANNAAGVFWYNETLTSGDLNTGWTIPTNTSHVLAPGRGYRLFVRGDRSDINRITNANPNQNAVTIDVTGPVNKGDITMPVTFTNSGNLSNDGWNLVGNPYPSPFDWKTFHQTGRSGNSGTNYTNIEPTIWVLDPVENTYKFYNTLSSEGTIADGILSESQGFWVKATGPGASITFKESFKAEDAPTQLFKSTPGGAFKIKLLRDALNADDLLVKYMVGSTTNFDAYDVVKLSSPVLVSAWGNDSVHLALSTRPLTTQNDTIKLYVSGSSGTYTMQFTNSDKIALQDQVLLFDTYTNNVVDLKQNNSYSFNINTNTAATFGFNRFYIIVANNNQLPVKLLTFNAKKENNNQVKLNWSTAIERNSSRFEIEHATDNKNFKPVGVVNAKGNSNVLTQYTFTHNSTSSINYYRLKQIDLNNTFDYSKVVMVNFNENEEIIIEPVKIYPIPAKNEVTIELNRSQNITAISIYKLDGALINNIQSNNPKVKLEISDLPQGVYVLQIEDEFGEIFKRKLIKE
jgi:hypothetical protein